MHVLESLPMQARNGSRRSVGCWFSSNTHVWLVSADAQDVVGSSCAELACSLCCMDVELVYTCSTAAGGTQSASSFVIGS